MNSLTCHCCIHFLRGGGGYNWGSNVTEQSSQQNSTAVNLSANDSCVLWILALTGDPFADCFPENLSFNFFAVVSSILLKRGTGYREKLKRNWCYEFKNMLIKILTVPILCPEFNNCTRVVVSILQLLGACILYVTVVCLSMVIILYLKLLLNLFTDYRHVRLNHHRHQAYHIDS